MASTLNYALIEKMKKEKTKTINATPTRKAQSRNVADDKDISIASPLSAYGAKKDINSNVSEYSSTTKKINLGNIEDLAREENLYKTPNGQ